MKVLVTGGAGFVGCHVADYWIKEGAEVTVLDNLSRRGAERNLAWLQNQHGAKLHFARVDVRDADAVTRTVKEVRPNVIYHFAAQVAVTTSVTDPRSDFEVNALGTFNVLEAARRLATPPMLFFTSTNKVYGGMEDVVIEERETRYAYRDYSQGISEERSLDFHSPYGCSKGAADQYVHDYARIYGLKSVVFRMSCIYGTRQFGNEDQGWVAHFVIAAEMGQSLAIYGDGKQVRDILFVEDLVRAFRVAGDNIDTTIGQVYNIGGGAANTISVWREFGPLLEKLCGRGIPVTYGDWRPGDQLVYVSDIRKAARDFGWKPQISKDEGIARLHAWVSENRGLFE